ncbi:helix-turn-helix transcriptional regulator [Paenibacillus cremeus]|uniref:Helix-turn-helix transcriptional regulator n=2 Tax=Paenibacillus cremeus TaxID=2163881 RepID=A0A559KH06_9BACL|nr:helix-turn-helix transcriptional regulator [Paenibacillus cremeus]
MVSHTYFQRKEFFEESEDTYPVWVLFGLAAGKFRFWIGEQSGEAGPGDLIFCPPGCTFKREMLSPLELHFIYFNIAGSQPFMPALQLPTVLSHPLDGKRLASNYAYLRKLHLTTDPRSFHRKQMILNDLWQLACENWEGEQQQQELSNFADSEDSLMNQAAEWLYRHAYTPFGMSELSRSLGLSPVQLTRRFRKSFRMTPSYFVKALRIRKGAGLLLETNMTLDQIAAHCGYENGFYFSRVFAQLMSVSPSKFRELNRV